MGKPPGKGKITGEMIRYLQDEDKKELLNLLNLIAKNPQDCRTGMKTPIFEKRDSKLCSNFRGIILTSTVGKNLRQISKRKTIEHNLEESQAGFCKERALQDQAFTLKDRF